MSSPQVGITDREADETLGTPKGNINARVKQFKNVMQQLNHTWVDVLKLDIQGYEYRALWPLLSDDGNLPFSQIVVEFHDIVNRMEAPKIYRLLKALEVTGGYRVMHQGPNMANP